MAFLDYKLLSACSSIFSTLHVRTLTSMVATGLEAPIIIAVARALQSKLNLHSTSELYEQATTILDDQNLFNLLEKLSGLNEKAAIRNHTRYLTARAACDATQEKKGALNTFARYKNARKGYHLAFEYQAYVRRNTADELQKALWNKKQKKNHSRASKTEITKSEDAEIHVDARKPVTTMAHSSTRASHPTFAEHSAVHKRLDSEETDMHSLQRGQRRRSAAQYSNYLNRSPSMSVISHPRGTPENPIMYLSADCLPDRIPEGLIYGTVIIDGKSRMGSANAGHGDSQEQVASQISPIEDQDTFEVSQHRIQTSHGHHSVKNEEPERSHVNRGSNRSHDTPDSKDMAEAARVVVTAITTYDDEDHDDKAISIASSFSFDLNDGESNSEGYSDDENNEDRFEVDETEYESCDSEDGETEREEGDDDDLEA
ncbi:hypothetical protein FB446DRAFT_751488 [Lentinula raphanica]|nr:hypothetical protein FB446DRAFT_751488 [Lentinula raphanica]